MQSHFNVGNGSKNMGISGTGSDLKSDRNSNPIESMKKETITPRFSTRTITKSTFL